MSELDQLEHEQASIRTLPLDLRKKMGVTRNRKKRMFRVPEPVLRELTDVFRIEKIGGQWMCCQNRVQNIDLERYCMIRNGNFETGNGSNNRYVIVWFTFLIVSASQE
jgi:hypothetical protein